MGRLIRIPATGGREPDLNALGQQLDSVVQTVDGRIGFGEPQDPNDPTSTTLAGAGFGTPAAGHHNGTVANIEGSWVEIALTTLGMTKATCYHNLYLDNPQYAVPVTGQPNCRWLPFGVQHDGTGKDSGLASSRVGVDVCFLGDTVAANSIQLRFNVRSEGDEVTVDSDHPVLVTLFFTRATRGE